MRTSYPVILSCLLILALLVSCSTPGLVGGAAEKDLDTIEGPAATEDTGGITFTPPQPPPPPPRPPFHQSEPFTPTYPGSGAGIPVPALPGVPPYGYPAMEFIEFMNDNLYARTPFSYRELEAALWIVGQLLYMGYTQEDIEVQPFSWYNVYEWRMFSWELMEIVGVLSAETTRQGRLSQNVILTVPGQSEQVIVVGAHYDSHPYPGASDNASGVALLLESALRMLHHDNYYTIVYVFFGAEEAGILGAYYYLNSLSEEQRDAVSFMVNADVLLEGPYLLYAAGYDREGYPQASAITRRVDAIAADLLEHYGIAVNALPEGIFWETDHIPFLEAGHTVVVFAGLYLDPDGFFQPRILHTYRDCIHYINQTWPGKAPRAMQAYSFFLERILLDAS